MFLDVFSKSIFAMILFKINAQESTKYKTIETSNDCHPFHPNNSQNIKQFLNNFHKISSNNLMTRVPKLIFYREVKEAQEVIGCLISEILGYTLKEDNIFLLYDSEVMKHFDGIEFLLYNNLKNKPHITSALQNFDIDNYDVEIISGYKFTTICLIYDINILQNLFLNRTIDYKWAPAILLIVFLDHQTTIPDVVFDSSIQRSHYIFIIDLTVKKKKIVFQTYTIYPFERNKTDFSKWKAFTGLYNLPRKKSDIFVERNKKFGGRLLHLASICEDFPFLFRNKNNKCIGVNIEILKIISKSLNFRFNIQYETEDGHWAFIENNTFKGMFRDLHQNGKDLMINLHQFTIKEYNYFDSSFPYLYEGFGFLCRIPGPTPVWRNIFLPFSFALWCFFLTTIITLISIIFLLKKFGFRSENNYRYSTSFLLVLGIMFRQNVNMNNKRNWFIFLVSVWLIGSLVIMSSYSGNLVSFMTFPRFQKRIETLKEIINSNLRVGTIDYGAPWDKKLLISPDENLRKVAEKLDSYPNKNFNYSRVIELVKSNHHVFSDGYSYLYHLQNYYNITGETYLLKEQNEYRQELKLQHLQTAFYGLLIGYFISLVILFLELLINFLKK